MKWAVIFAVAFAAGIPFLPRAASATPAACTAGATTCSNDTLNDYLVTQAISDPSVQVRIFELWMQLCANIYSESATTTGHALRGGFCESLAAGKVPGNVLVSAILNSTTVGEIEAGAGEPSPAGNLVDADVNTAIGSAMTIAVNTASTTATAASGSSLLTVASATGIVPGQTVAGPGIAAGTTVLYVNGTSVAISQPVTAALSSSGISFTFYGGLAARQWG